MKNSDFIEEDGVDDVVEEEPEVVEAEAPDLADAGLMLQEAVALYVVGTSLITDALAEYPLNDLDVNSIDDVKDRLVALISNWQSGRPFDFKELAALAVIGLSKGL